MILLLFLFLLLFSLLYFKCFIITVIVMISLLLQMLCMCHLGYSHCLFSLLQTFIADFSRID